MHHASGEKGLGMGHRSAWYEASEASNNPIPLSSKCNHPHAPGQIQAFWSSMALGGGGYHSTTQPPHVLNITTQHKDTNNPQHKQQKHNYWQVSLILP